MRIFYEWKMLLLEMETCNLHWTFKEAHTNYKSCIELLVSSFWYLFTYCQLLVGTKQNHTTYYNCNVLSVVGQNTIF